MCVRATLFLLCLCASTVRADPLGDWFARDDAILVVILVDGLVDEFIDARTQDGDLLMPRTSAWAEPGTRYVDVLATSTDAALARSQLDRELESFGADSVRVLSVGTGAADAPVQEIALIAGRSGRQILLLDIPWLVPPLNPTRESLLRLDPAPWSAMHGVREMEAQVRRRINRARQLVPRAARGSQPLRGDMLRDTRWFIESAHADFDARLAPVLDALEDPALGRRAGVLLTATSSSGLGGRGPVGPGIGVSLDVALVPVILKLPSVVGGIDPGPRQWIRLDADWFRSAGTDDRLTWSCRPAVERDRGLCELRWTTAGFTLIDSTLPQQAPRLYDRQLDPGEWLDRGISLSALADSLQSELRSRLYGPAPVLVFSAGPDEAVELQLDSRSTMEGPAGRTLDSLRLRPGETLRVRLVGGAANVHLGGLHSVQIGAEQLSLEELVVHSPQWRAAMAGPGPHEGFRIWIE